MSDQRQCPACHAWSELAALPSGTQPVCHACDTLLQYPPVPGSAPAAPRMLGLAVAAFVVGIIGLIPGALFLNLLALAFAIGALADLRRDGTRSGRGLAWAAFIMGAIGLCVSIVVLLFLVYGLLAPFLVYLRQVPGL